MREFEVTLNAVSRKTFKLRADSKEEAILLAEAILENTDLLSFSDEDVSSMDISKLGRQNLERQRNSSEESM